MVRISTTLSGVPRCPHCGIADPNLNFRAVVSYLYRGDRANKAWFIYQCNSCGDIVAARGVADYGQITQHLNSFLANNAIIAEAIVPAVNELDDDIPARPRRYLAQAISSLAAPDGAVMLAGSAVDAMLKEAGYIDGTTYKRIEQAVSDHVLTPAMSEWAHAVRLESNKPRHADVDEPHASKELAEQTIKFAEALAEYLFVLPARIGRGKAASEAAANEGAEEG